jgi:hypothetical protein
MSMVALPLLGEQRRQLGGILILADILHPLG